MRVRARAVLRRCASRGAWLHRKAGTERAHTLRLRGGKDIPIDMKIFYWLEDQGGRLERAARVKGELKWQW